MELEHHNIMKKPSVLLYMYSNHVLYWNIYFENVLLTRSLLAKLWISPKGTESCSGPDQRLPTTGRGQNGEENQVRRTSLYWWLHHHELGVNYLFTFTKWDLYQESESNAKYYMCKSWKIFLHCLGIILTSLYICKCYYSTYQYLKLATRVAGFH